MVYVCFAGFVELFLFWLLVQETVRFDRTISVGNVISASAAVIAGVGAWYALRGQVNTLGDRLAVHRQELDKKTKDVELLGTTIGALQVTMATLNVTVGNLANQFEKFDKRFDTLSDKVDDTREEVLKKNGGKRRH